MLEILHHVIIRYPVPSAKSKHSMVPDFLSVSVVHWINWLAEEEAC
jgi:hypothetical protein